MGTAVCGPLRPIGKGPSPPSASDRGREWLLPQSLLADRVLLLNRRIVAEGYVYQIMNRMDLMDGFGLEMPILADLFKTLQEVSLYSGAIPFKKDEVIGAIRVMLQK